MRTLSLTHSNCRRTAQYSIHYYPNAQPRDETRSFTDKNSRRNYKLWHHLCSVELYLSHNLITFFNQFEL